jgi:hypothetical protein
MEYTRRTWPERNESFPISIDYCNHWELWQSIREIVANCFDAMYEFLCKRNIDSKLITVNKV